MRRSRTGGRCRTPGLLWVNTALLLLGSGALQLARTAAGRDDLAALKRHLTVGGGLTIAFLVGQLIAWRQLTAAGYFMATNPADAFFYILTGLHGAHMLGGLWFWARATPRGLGGAGNASGDRGRPGAAAGAAVLGLLALPAADLAGALRPAAVDVRD